MVNLLKSNQLGRIQFKDFYIRLRPDFLLKKVRDKILIKRYNYFYVIFLIVTKLFFLHYILIECFIFLFIHKIKVITYMSETNEKSYKSDAVILRRYPKVIFFYPLLIVSFILFLIQYILNSPDLNKFLGFIWILIFFCNLFVIAIDTTSGKLFFLALIIVGLIMMVAYIIAPQFDLSIFGFESDLFNFSFTAQFYLVITVILAFILLFVWLEERFDYWKIEKNEIYHKKGILSNLERYPSSGLKYTKEISDIFEFLALKAGRVILFIDANTIVTLDTVINVNKKMQKLDNLLSQFRVKVVNP